MNEINFRSSKEQIEKEIIQRRKFLAGRPIGLRCRCGSSSYVFGSIKYNECERCFAARRFKELVGEKQ